MNNKPIHSIRLGSVQASIWLNKKDNSTWHTVTVSRTYRDGEQWKYSETFGRDELPLVAKAVDMAHTWILQKGQTDKAA